MADQGTKARASDLLDVAVTTNPRAIQILTEEIIGRIAQVVERSLERQLAALQNKHIIAKEADASTPGARVSKEERVKAAELRTELLLGKVPEETGILIDTEVAARLLSISPRTLYRLHDLQAVPEPVRLNTLVRWRLADLLEWVEAGCPGRRHWSARSGKASK